MFVNQCLRPFFNIPGPNLRVDPGRAGCGHVDSHAPGELPSLSGAGAEGARSLERGGRTPRDDEGEPNRSDADGSAAWPDWLKFLEHEVKQEGPAILERVMGFRVGHCCRKTTT